MSDYLKEVLKAVKNDYADVASNGIAAGDITGFIDTGSYLLNALMSGSIYQGIPNSKIAIFGSPEGVGKTFILLSTIKTFLDDNPTGCVFLFESESALSKDMMEERGLDTKRIIVFPVVTVEEFRHQMVVILDNYIEQKEKRPVFFGLDSLGMLSTNKEIGDITEGKDTRDMTRSQLLKAAFRVITLKLGRVKVPLFCTNHTYQTMEMFSKSVQSGGSGGKYASSVMVSMTKRKVKDGKDLQGNIVTCTLDKGRLCKEGSKVEIYIDFANGLSRYHGLVEEAVNAGIWKKAGNRIDVYNNDTDKAIYPKAIYADPEKFFTKEILDKIDVWVGTKYKYGVLTLEDEI